MLVNGNAVLHLLLNSANLHNKQCHHHVVSIIKKPLFMFVKMNIKSGNFQI